MPFARRYLPWLLAAAAIVTLYLTRLDGVGLLSTDEPRYAAIGEEMAHTGNWLTPELWGRPWFEKPPLLYWMTAIGQSTGLSRESACRMPVALLSLVFLLFFCWSLRRRWGTNAAMVGTCLLATSAGWLAYSGLCLTDIPMAVFFSAAVLILLPLADGNEVSPQARNRLLWAGAFLGLAALAKGLVPLALTIPIFWFTRRWWKMWPYAALTCAAVAGPWYVLMYRHWGMQFINEFFLKHHLERLYSQSLQHVQPAYYYIPVFLIALFPWTPLLAVFAWRPAKWGNERWMLLSIVLFGFGLFSASLNKLAGYVLPLLPSFFALLGSQWETADTTGRRAGWWIGVCAVLISAIPVLATALDELLRPGHAPFNWDEALAHGSILLSVIPIVAVFTFRRTSALPVAILCAALGGLFLKTRAFPALDRNVSSRALWKSLEARHEVFCTTGINRSWEYGLGFYAGHEIPNCGGTTIKLRLYPGPEGVPVVKKLP